MDSRPSPPPSPPPAGRLKPDDVDRRMCRALADLGPRAADEAVDKFAQANLESVRSKAGFMMGIIRRLGDPGGGGWGTASHTQVSWFAGTGTQPACGATAVLRAQKYPRIGVPLWFGLMMKTTSGRISPPTVMDESGESAGGGSAMDGIWTSVRREGLTGVEGPQIGSRARAATAS